MTRLDIYAMGAFRLVGDQQSMVILTSRRAQLLLTFLATDRSRPHNRLTLAALCWPEIDELRARASLRVELHKIRRLLATVGLEDALRTDDTWIQLLPDAPIWLDSRAFVLEAEAGIADASVARTEQTAQLVRAAALYQGEFLDGSYDEWAVAERDRFGRLYEAVLAKLVRLHLNARTYDHAIAYARLSLARNPLDEPIHRALMRALAASGQRSSALAQYRACVALLAEEFGIAPEAETEQLRTEIEASLDVEAPFSGELTPLFEHVTPFVGREHELSLVRSGLHNLSLGQGSVLVMNGEAGIGKSRLLQLTSAAALQQGLLILEARCYELERGMLLQPLIDVLRQHIDLVATHSENLPAALRSVLFGLLPELLPLLPDGAPRFTAISDRAAQYQALSVLVRTLALSGRGLLLTIDDFHRADSSTVELLHFLGRQLHDLPLMIVIAQIDADIPAHIEALCESIGQRIPGCVVTVPPLQSDEVAHLVTQHVAAHQWSPAQHARLTGHVVGASGGNPFFALELLRGLTDGGQAADGAATESDRPVPLHLPASLREAITQRLRPLSSATRHVLNQASVIGPRFGWDVLLPVSDQDPDVLLLALEELISRRVLRSLDGQWYDFAHELVREVVYQAVHPQRRRRLHEKVAQVLAQKLDSAERLDGELAYHFLRSDSPRRAVGYLTRTGDRAHRLSVFDQAEQHYLRAVELITPADDSVEAADLWSKLALNALAAGRTADARRFQSAAFRGWESQPALGLSAGAATPPHADFRLVSSYAGISSFDPSHGAGREAWRVIVQLFEGLVRFDPRMHVVPALAERWEISADGRHYRFQLRKDAYWSDGRAVTAHDVVFGWCRALRLATSSSLSSMLFDIVGAPELAADPTLPDDRLAATAYDDATLDVHLAAPVSRFLYVMALPIAFPVPRHSVERHGDAWALPQQLVCNGPFCLAATSEALRLELVRSPTYHGRTGGNVARVEITVQPDPARRLQDYLRGDVDMIAELTAQEQRWARRHRPAELVVRPALSTTFTAYNWRVAPFADLRTRRVLALAVDRDSWARQIEGPDALGAGGGFVPPGIAGHSERIAPLFDPQYARFLLAETALSFSSAAPLVIATSAGFQEGARYIAEQWREHLQLDVAVRVDDVGTLIQDWLAGRIAVLHLARSTNYPDADNWLRYAVRGLQVFAPTETAAARLLAAAAAATDEATRLIHVRALDRLLVQDALALTPLTYEPFAWLVRPWVQGFHFGAFSHWTSFHSLSVNTEQRAVRPD